jgi:very-short-patch-repair endonuclease
MAMESDLSQIAGRYRRTPEALLLRARELRQQQTSTEQILWIFLRGRRLGGAKFRRQHAIGQFIADFYCHEARLVIELNGKIHQAQQARDADRDAWMLASGLTVLRFDNEAIWNRLKSVLEEIFQHVMKGSMPSSPALLPRGEGGQILTPSPPGEGRGEGSTA